jgi:hypothetical protein
VDIRDVIQQLYYQVNMGVYGDAWELIQSLSLRITGTGPVGPWWPIGPTGPTW